MVQRRVVVSSVHVVQHGSAPRGGGGVVQQRHLGRLGSPDSTQWINLSGQCDPLLRYRQLAQSSNLPFHWYTQRQTYQNGAKISQTLILH